jgi:SAM-dependent methyltransferase
VDEAFQSHYALGMERDRLTEGADHLELVRTLELLKSALPLPPADVLDVGGGPGVYASRLAGYGYRVHLVDVLPLHVEQALALAAVQPDAPFTAEVGDARCLQGLDDESVDVVLLFGPLYHLTAREDRVGALAEARRLVRPTGVVVAAVISRFASLLDGTVSGFLDDPQFVTIVERDLRDGQHRNPEPVTRPEWFTTAFFHRPQDVAEEVEAAGLQLERLVGVEGPGGWFARWPEQAQLVLQAARLAEDIPAMSAHMLAIARRPSLPVVELDRHEEEAR